MIRAGWARPVGSIGLGAALLGVLVLRGDGQSDGGGSAARDDRPPRPLAGGERLRPGPLPHPAVRMGEVPWRDGAGESASAAAIRLSPVSKRARLLASASDVALVPAPLSPAHSEKPGDPLPAPDFTPVDSAPAVDLAVTAAIVEPEDPREVAPIEPAAEVAPIAEPAVIAQAVPDKSSIANAPPDLPAVAQAVPGSETVDEPALVPEVASSTPVAETAVAEPVAVPAPAHPVAPPVVASVPDPMPPLPPVAIAEPEPQFAAPQPAVAPPPQPPAPEPQQLAAAGTPPSPTPPPAAAPSPGFPEPDFAEAGPPPAPTARIASIGVERTPGSARRTIAARRTPSAPPNPPDAARAPVRDAPIMFPEPAFGAAAAPGPALAAVAAQPAPQSASPLTAPPTVQPARAALAPAGGVGTFPSAGPPSFSYDDELILQIRVADYPGDDTLVAYGTRAGVYLPFGLLARFLDLGIAVSDDGHYASGWFLDEKRTLVIDLRQHRLTVAGEERPLDRSDAVAFDGELYLRAERYAEILPLEMAVNLRDQSVTIRTREPFPFEQRLKREADRARLGSKSTAEPPRWPREETPWRALSLPMADVELRAMSDSTYGTRGEADLRLAGDLAFMTAQAYLSSTTRDGLVSSNVSLGRADADGGLFGPLKATEFAIGDVSTPALPMGLRGTGGRGAFIGNVPIESRSVFDRIDLRGVLPDGYEVELYRNDILIGSTREPVNGEYRFEQVSLDYGLNVLRLVFYGPQGQRTEEVRRISVGDGRLGSGQLVYSAGVAQKDVNLLDVRGPRFFRREDFGAWRAVGQLSYGFTSGLTGTVGGAWFQSDRGTRWLGTAGLRTGIAGIATRLDLGLSAGGAKAATVGIGGRLLGASVTFNHGEYRGDFIDEVRSPNGAFLRRVTELEANATIQIGSGLSGLAIPVAARARRLEARDGRVETSATLRASTRFSGLLASNTLDYAQSSGGGSRGRSQLLGSFDLATLSRSKWQLRGSLGYAVLPAARIVSGALEVDRAIDDSTILHGAISHAFESRDTQFGLSAVRRFDRFTLAVEGSYGTRQKSYSASLRLGMSLGRNPVSGRFFMAPPGQASSGGIALRAFHDADGDRRFGPGDEPIEGVQFLSGNRTGTSDANGIALLTGLGSGNRVSVQADLKTLPDIALSPISRGIEIVARPGRVHASAYPVVELSEIEGTAYFAGNGSQRGVSGVRLQLIDSTDKPVKTVRTESDGFYLFEQIAPGTYKVRLDPEQAARLRIRMVDMVSVTVTAKSAVLSRAITVESE